MLCLPEGSTGFTHALVRTVVRKRRVRWDGAMLWLPRCLCNFKLARRSRWPCRPVHLWNKTKLCEALKLQNWCTTPAINNTTQLSGVMRNLHPSCRVRLPSCYWETQADVIMRQRNKENDVISRFVPGEVILLLDQHVTLQASSASSACFFFLCGTFCSAISE